MSLNQLNSAVQRSIYSFLETDLNEITPHLYLGDKRTSQNHRLLKQLGIRRIVVAGEELALHHPSQFQYLHLPLKDSLKEDISLHFCKVCQFIEEGLLNEQAVFVHCALGISRSPTLVIAYLMKTLKISFRQAFSLVRRKRPDVKPNQSFQQQLQTWQARVRESDFNHVSKA